jgi:hypothetical protein
MEKTAREKTFLKDMIAPSCASPGPPCGVGDASEIPVQKFLHFCVQTGTTTTGASQLRGEVPEASGPGT